MNGSLGSSADADPHRAGGDQWAEMGRLALAATPGPWQTFEVRHRGPGYQIHVGRGRNGVAHVTGGEGVIRTKNAAFIAAANPSAVLELIAAARANAVGISAPAEIDQDLTPNDVAREDWLADMCAPAVSVEPCYECGSTERIGTACRPCNPEITDPNFGVSGEPETGGVAKMAHILRGMVERGHTIDLEAIARAETLAAYRQDPTDEDRAWAAQAALSAAPVDQSRGEVVAWRALLMEAIRGWIREDCEVAVKLTLTTPQRDKLIDRILSALKGGENV